MTCLSCEIVGKALLFYLKPKTALVYTLGISLLTPYKAIIELYIVSLTYDDSKEKCYEANNTDALIRISREMSTVI